MSQQEKQEINNHDPLIEDLTVNQEKEEEVKGGAIVDYYLKLDGIDGESTDARATRPGNQLNANR